MRGLLRGCLLVLFVGGPGCSLMLGDGYSSSRPGNPDGSIADGGVGDEIRNLPDGAADVLDAEASIRPYELLTNADFEAPGTNCGQGWGSYKGSLQRGTGHAGMSCRVCRTGSNEDWFGANHPFASPLAPGKYRLEAWYRSSPNVSSCEIGVNVTVTGGGSRQGVTQTCVSGSAEWQRLSLTESIAPGEEVVDFYAAALATAGVCFDVDDVSLTKL